MMRSGVAVPSICAMVMLSACSFVGAQAQMSMNSGATAHLVRTATGNGAAGQATRAVRKSVEVPEGTPVVFHLFGTTSQFSMNMTKEQPVHHVLIQVDENVVVNGEVVVPRGAMGQADMLAPKLGHRRGARGDCILTKPLMPSFVFSIASTRLTFVAEPVYTDEENGTGVFETVVRQVSPLQDAQFKGKLAHVVLNL